jgi:hypothetical protein
MLARRTPRLAPVPFADDYCGAVATTIPVGYKAICKVLVLLGPSNMVCGTL